MKDSSQVVVTALILGVAPLAVLAWHADGHLSSALGVWQLLPAAGLIASLALIAAGAALIACRARVIRAAVTRAEDAGRGRTPSWLAEMCRALAAHPLQAALASVLLGEALLFDSPALVGWAAAMAAGSVGWNRLAATAPPRRQPQLRSYAPKGRSRSLRPVI